jgi:anti-sigma B factor antagonist/stage II sporulation protein AA (anti-sigma F factor antagonist)
MTDSPTTFAIQESQDHGCVRLSLTGELDMGSAPILEDRLASLRAMKSPVSLDLSHLEFIDSTGLHLLVRTVGDAQIKGWELEIEQDVAPDVMRLFKLVHLDRFVLGGRRTSAGRPVNK